MLSSLGDTLLSVLTDTSLSRQRPMGELWGGGQDIKKMICEVYENEFRRDILPWFYFIYEPLG